jgi:hypothetical protein
LTIIVTDRISIETSEYLGTSAYLRKRRNVRKELIQRSNRVIFWLACPWLNAPTIEDIETIRSLSESRLRDYYKLIRESLSQMISRGFRKLDGNFDFEEFLLVDDSGNEVKN